MGHEFVIMQTLTWLSVALSANLAAMQAQVNLEEISLLHEQLLLQEKAFKSEFVKVKSHNGVLAKRGSQ